MAKSIKGSKTEQNLLKAFAGESQARNRYTYFASAARKENFQQIANIFQETADNEKEHAKVFFCHLEGGDLEITATYPAGAIKDTKANLEAAAAGRRWSGRPCIPSSARLPGKRDIPRWRARSSRSPRRRSSTRRAIASSWSNVVGVSNGRGIPVDIHKTEGVSAAEVVLTKLQCGTKFPMKATKYQEGSTA